MKRPKRKFSKLNVIDADYVGRIGGLIVYVQMTPPYSSITPDGFWITGNRQLPQEIIAAAKTWVTSDNFANMSLTEYLNKMFDAENYSKQSL